MSSIQAKLQGLIALPLENRESLPGRKYVDLCKYSILLFSCTTSQITGKQPRWIVCSSNLANHFVSPTLIGPSPLYQLLYPDGLKSCCITIPDHSEELHLETLFQIPNTPRWNWYDELSVQCKTLHSRTLGCEASIQQSKFGRAHMKLATIAT